VVLVGCGPARCVHDIYARSRKSGTWPTHSAARP